MKNSAGALVISLDFELWWGVRDHIPFDRYRANLLGVRQAVPAMLQLFADHGIHATWATVGLLFCNGREEALRNVPARLPRYADARLSPYAELKNLGASEDEDPCRLSPSLLRSIAQSPGQEIGSHTFSHYYCLEPPQDPAAFRADMEAALRAAASFGIRLTSLVFPRNQYAPEYLRIAGELGIQSYRGIQSAALYSIGDGRIGGRLQRAARLLDSYFPVGTRSEVTESNNWPINIPADAFLRPYSRRLAALEPFRLRRIRRGLEAAARNGRTFHLWWHPHNFGVNLEQNLAFLRQILSCFEEFRRRYGMESLNMGEVAARVRPRAQGAVV